MRWICTPIYIPNWWWIGNLVFDKGGLPVFKFKCIRKFTKNCQAWFYPFVLMSIVIERQWSKYLLIVDANVNNKVALTVWWNDHTISQKLTKTLSSATCIWISNQIHFFNSKHEKIRPHFHIANHETRSYVFNALTVAGIWRFIFCKINFMWRDWITQCCTVNTLWLKSYKK